MAVARAVLSAISRFVSAMAMLNFGGQQKVSTSVQNFVRMTLRKRSFVCSIPPRLQVLRPPIQPNHRLLNPRARTDPAGCHDLARRNPGSQTPVPKRWTACSSMPSSRCGACIGLSYSRFTAGYGSFSCRPSNRGTERPHTSGQQSIETGAHEWGFAAIAATSEAARARVPSADP
jgi:hypothetical protein